MSVVPGVSAASLHAFVLNKMQPGAKILADGWKGYSDNETLGYEHVATNISASGDPSYVVMPHVHLVALLLDRWWPGIHQAVIRPSRLDYYIDEFTFKFHRRSFRKRDLLFIVEWSNQWIMLL